MYNNMYYIQEMYAPHVYTTHTVECTPTTTYHDCVPEAALWLCRRHSSSLQHRVIGLRVDHIDSVVLRRGARGLSQNCRSGGYSDVGYVWVRGSISYGELFVVDDLSGLWPAC